LVLIFLEIKVAELQVKNLSDEKKEIFTIFVQQSSIFRQMNQ